MTDYGDHVPRWTFDLALWREYCEQIPAEEPRAADNTRVKNLDRGTWRDLPPTLKQVVFLKSHGYSRPATRGAASDTISLIKRPR